MYLGMVLILLGSLTPWLVIPAFAILIEVVYVRVEESMLQRQFGQRWLDYCRKTRKWI